MSLRMVTSLPESCSGDIYAGVPLRTSGPADVVGDAGQSEIRDHDLPTPIEHDVGGFQVAMQNALGMGRCQSGTKMACDVERFVGWKASDPPQQGSEIFAVDVLHGEERLAVDVAHVVHPANIGMGDPSRHPHFVAEAFQQTFVAGGFVRQKLHRDALSERQVVGAVNLAHAAFAEQRNDPVASGQKAPGKKSSFIQQVFGRTGGPGGRWSRRRRRSRRQRRSRGGKVERCHIIGIRSRPSAGGAKGDVVW